MSDKDIWYRWLRHRRDAGDSEQIKASLSFLISARDKILRNARLREGDVVLDVGCGEGLLGFGALQAAPTIQAIFADLSRDLLDHARAVAEREGLLDRCRFVHAPAEDLSPLEDGAVDVVVVRSVLMYVEAKDRAFGELRRVLRPGGRLSIFEPLLSFDVNSPPGTFWGYDVTPVEAIAAKVRAHYDSVSPPALDFDEQDLLAAAEAAGFSEIRLDHSVVVGANPPQVWETFLRAAPTPQLPNLEEAMVRALAPEEVAAWTAHLRPLVEAGRGTARRAVVYLSAIGGK